MTSSADKYVKNVVNDTGDEEEIVDSDGEVLGKNLWIRGLLEQIRLLSRWISSKNPWVVFFTFNEWP